jgi:butyryl-CoA dehydrogenase
MQIDQNTVAVVTGAASGIGRALSLRLAREGAALALADVNETGLGETARMLDGANVSTHILDVADREGFAAFVDDVVRRHGRANLVINNAGIGMAGTAEQLSLDDIEWLMGVNFWGVIYGTKMFLPILKQQPQAHIVNISSIFGIIGMPGHSAYVASKFAVRGFSEAMRHELQMAGSHVRLSVVHPGGIRTNIAHNARRGAGAAPDAVEKEIRNFDNAARTTPEQAAERIVRGVERNEDRILIGADAWALERIQRWAPVRYWRVMRPLLERMMKSS